MWTGTKKNEDLQIFLEHKSHLNRLRSIKGRTDTNPPKEVIHLKHKLKTKALRLMQESLITSDNQTLLQKMTEINTRRPILGKFSSDPLQKSLNAATRSQRITQITEENLQLLDRLQSTKSRYDFKKLDQDFQYKQYLKRKLSENSRRIPKVPSFAHSASFESNKGLLSRPTTASAGLKRPSSSMCKSKLSTFDMR
jgi:hypothetical protein